MPHGLEPVVIPLPEGVLGLDFQHAAAEKQSHEKIRPGVGVAIDIEGEFVSAPIRLPDLAADQTVTGKAVAVHR
jgi:hypothetical protein